MRRRFAEKDQFVTGLRAFKRCDFRHVFDEANAANNRGRRDRDAVRLVIEGDVTGHDREVQLATGGCHALNRFHDIAHGVRLFRVAEIEVVSDRNRLCANR